jgi:cytochrome c2
VRDPQAGWLARLRAPLLALALLGMIGAGIASVVAPAQRDEWQSVPIDAGVHDAAGDGGIDAPVDAYHADPERGAQVAQSAGCPACHDSRTGARDRGPSFIGMWGSKIPLDVAGKDKKTAPAYATVDDAYVWEKLSYPQAKVHAGYQLIHLAYRGRLADSGILDLIAYLRSLADQRPPAPDDAGIVDAEPAPSDGDAGEEAQDLVIAGARTIDRDTVIRGKHVTIADGARLRVRHGATLRIEADELTVQGAAEIDGTGDRGAPGRDGLAERDETVSDRKSLEQAMRRCQKKRPDGRAGGKGGPGATIILQARRIEDSGLAIGVDGGAGGEGGLGAPGHRIEWSEEPANIQIQQIQNPGPSNGGAGALAGQVDETQGKDDNAETKGAKAPAKKDPKVPAKKDAKSPPKKRSSPAPVRQRPPSPGRASRRDDSPKRDLPPSQPPRIRPRDTFQCPPGADGPPGRDGLAGKVVKSSPDDTGAAH